jgi:hypothetical protein
MKSASCSEVGSKSIYAATLIALTRSLRCSGMNRRQPDATAAHGPRQWDLLDATKFGSKGSKGRFEVASSRSLALATRFVVPDARGVRRVPVRSLQPFHRAIVRVPRCRVGRLRMRRACRSFVDIQAVVAAFDVRLASGKPPVALLFHRSDGLGHPWVAVWRHLTGTAPLDAFIDRFVAELAGRQN